MPTAVPSDASPCPGDGPWRAPLQPTRGWPGPGGRHGAERGAGAELGGKFERDGGAPLPAELPSGVLSPGPPPIMASEGEVPAELRTRGSSLCPVHTAPPSLCIRGRRAPRILPPPSPSTSLPPCTCWHLAPGSGVPRTQWAIVPLIWSLWGSSCSDQPALRDEAAQPSPGTTGRRGGPRDLESRPRGPQLLEASPVARGREAVYRGKLVPL